MSGIVAHTFQAGEVAVARGDAGYAAAGQEITIVQPLPGERARIAYVAEPGAQKVDLIVPTATLVPLIPGARSTDPHTSLAAGQGGELEVGRPSDTDSAAAVWAITKAGLEVWAQIPPSERPDIAGAA